MAEPIYPRRDVNIRGVPARAHIAGPAPVAAPRRIGPIDITPQFRTVKDAADMEREMGGPGDCHVCPLCDSHFGWEAFKVHAPACIVAHAPRHKVWTPPGMVTSPLQSFPDIVQLKGIGDY